MLKVITIQLTIHIFLTCYVIKIGMIVIEILILVKLVMCQVEWGRSVFKIQRGIPIVSWSATTSGRRGLQVLHGHVMLTSVLVTMWLLKLLLLLLLLLLMMLT